MLDLDLARLREIAEKATPNAGKDRDVRSFLLTFDPATVLKLLERIAQLDQDETRSAPLPGLLRGDIEIGAAVVVDSWTDWKDERTDQNFNVVEVAIRNLRNTIRDRMAQRGQSK